MALARGWEAREGWRSLSAAVTMYRRSSPDKDEAVRLGRGRHLQEKTQLSG